MTFGSPRTSSSCVSRFLATSARGRPRCAPSGTSSCEPLRLLVDPVDAVVDVEDLPAARELARAPPRVTTCSSQRVTIVRTARRSTGGVVMSERSRSPVTAIWSVRGMGVAVSVSTSTFAAQLLDALLVRDAEALLLVDDEEPQVLEVDVLREQAVRADDDVAPCRPSARRRSRPAPSCVWKRRIAAIVIG